MLDSLPSFTKKKYEFVLQNLLVLESDFFLRLLRFLFFKFRNFIRVCLVVDSPLPPSKPGTRTFPSSVSYLCSCGIVVLLSV